MLNIKTFAIALFGLCSVGVANVAAQTTDAASEPDRAAIEEIARQFYEPFNGASVNLFDDILTEDWSETPAPPDLAPGREPYKANIEGLRASAPSLNIEVEEVVVEGDLVAVRSRLTAIHDGPMLGVPATGLPINIMTMDMHRLEGNRIAETWHVEDWLSALQQIGAMGGETEEPQSRIEALFDRVFDSADQNRDGMISTREVTLFQQSVFLATDYNDDGELSLEEFLSLDFGESYEAHEAGVEGAVERVLSDYFERADRNQNGVLVAGEHVLFFLNDFRATDANGDGSLIRAEFIAGLPILQAFAEAINR